jgi:hypothetical protein
LSKRKANLQNVTVKKKMVGKVVASLGLEIPTITA